MKEKTLFLKTWKLFLILDNVSHSAQRYFRTEIWPPRPKKCILSAPEAFTNQNNSPPPIIQDLKILFIKLFINNYIIYIFFTTFAFNFW